MWLPTVHFPGTLGVGTRYSKHRVLVSWGSAVPEIRVCDDGPSGVTQPQSLSLPRVQAGSPLHSAAAPPVLSKSWFGPSLLELRVTSASRNYQESFGWLLADCIHLTNANQNKDSWGASGED